MFDLQRTRQQSQRLNHFSTSLLIRYKLPSYYVRGRHHLLSF